MASSVDASSSSESCVDKMLQMLSLGHAGTVAGLSWSWSAVGANSWVAQELLLVKLEPGRCSEKTKCGLRRLSGVSF